jgi:HEAT repeat protein
MVDRQFPTCSLEILNRSMQAKYLGLLTLAAFLIAGCNSEPSMDFAKLPQPVNLVLQPTAGNSTQIAAADALGRIGQPAVPALAESLADPDPFIRLQSCNALAYMGAQAKDAVAALIRALNDPETAVREAAAGALGQIGAPANPAVPALIQMLHGKSAATVQP